MSVDDEDFEALLQRFTPLALLEDEEDDDSPLTLEGVWEKKYDEERGRQWIRKPRKE